MSYIILRLNLELMLTIKIGMLVGVMRVQTCINDEWLILTIEYDPSYTNSTEIEQAIRSQVN